MSHSVLDVAVRDVRAQLGQYEVIRVVVQGGGAQFMVGTDYRVFVWKKGWLAGATFGQKLASWDYRNITGIHMNTGLISGVLVIQAPGVQSGTVKFQSSIKSENAFALPHAIPLRHGEFAQAEQGVATLRWLIAAAQRPAPVLANGPTEFSWPPTQPPRLAGVAGDELGTAHWRSQRH